MSDFAVMRKNMVNGQILPENVTHPLVIEALLKIPREKFIPWQFARSAYIDTNLSFNTGCMLLRPATLARLLEALNPTSTDSILYIAAGTGYGAALLGHMKVHVIALDFEESLTQDAERLLQDLKLSSIEVVLGPLAEGWKKKAPYEKIIIEGTVDYIPKSLLAQLKERGQIITLKYCKRRGIRAIKLVKQQGVLTEIFLFDAFAPRLKAFRQQSKFIF